ncbi:ABC transporter ATP-binding protein [Rhizobium sp. S152]|uniref:ABC transporter ATP-binding protein n=1 Tax=Rhizobium sp. S152 TaxID=3055038 RepID=UPI0025A942A4|nr:ABC transporter ATP-binding protein [Rhizobium sp. S152]MDM9625796.1 ABC transporter ATP-binding protein [Rhizobium sp. S152]
MSITVDKVQWAAGNRLIVDGVSLDVTPGKMLGLLGPNGSGKSSLLRLISGLRKVKSGVIRLGDADVSSMRRIEIARRVALVEQQSGTDAQLTVGDVVKLGRTPHRGALGAWNADDQRAVSNALKQVDMAERAGQLWHTLSGGERQRVQIARALAQTPSELLLDEPTNHLDIQHQLEILSLVSRIPVTSVVALHDLNLAAMFCDSLAVLHYGRLVASGTPEEVLTETLIKDVFGVCALVTRSEFHGRVQVHYRMA